MFKYGPNQSWNSTFLKEFNETLIIIVLGKHMWKFGNGVQYEKYMESHLLCKYFICLFKRTVPLSMTCFCFIIYYSRIEDL